MIQVRGPGPFDVLAFVRQPALAGSSGGVMHFGFRLTDPADLDMAVREVEHAGGRLLKRGEFAPGVPFAFMVDPDGYENRDLVRMTASARLRPPVAERLDRVGEVLLGDVMIAALDAGAGTPSSARRHRGTRPASRTCSRRARPSCRWDPAGRSSP